MKKERRLVFTSRFHDSILQAVDYYEGAQKDLGDYFLASLDSCVLSIVANPDIYQIIYQNYRQAKVKRFPYVVIYRIKPDEIVLENVFNTHQNPLKKIR